MSTPNGVFHLISLLSLWCLFDDCFMIQRANVNRKYIKQNSVLSKGKTLQTRRESGTSEGRGRRITSSDAGACCFLPIPRKKDSVVNQASYINR